MRIFNYRKNLLIFLSLFSVAGLLGCDLYGDGYNLETSVSECEASGADCSTGTGASALAVSISNANPYVVHNAAERTFDIAGFCNEADFPQNFIEWSIYLTRTNTPIQVNQKVYQACKRGKFRFQVSIQGTPSANEQHRLTLELVGTDLNGVEQRNVVAARRHLDLLAIAP